MGERSTSGDPEGRLPPEGEHADLQGAFELLSARQYGRVEQLLQERQEAAQRSGQMAMVVILAAAIQLCFTCREFRAEMQLHQHALEESIRREKELRRQLQAILALLASRSASELEASLETRSVVDPAQSLPPDSNQSQSNLGAHVLQKVLGFLEGSVPALTFRRRTHDTAGLEREKKVTEVIPGPDEIQAKNATTADIVVRKDDLTAESKDRDEHFPGVSEETPYPEASRLPREESLTPRFGVKKERPLLVFYCLGPFRVYLNDEQITEWNSLKAQLILKYLVAREGKPVAKEILMDVFWPDSNTEATRRNLHQAIYSLRQTLRRRAPNFQHILFEHDRYLLNPEMDLWLDFEEFQKHVQAGRRLEAAGQVAEAMAEYGIAEGLYQGNFLEEVLYEEWCRWQREQIRDMYLDISDRLSEYYLQNGEYAAAMALCQKELAGDNCYEQAHLRLMRCYLAQHQRHMAVRQYQICRELLKSELELEPSEETTALYRKLTA